MEQRLFRVVTNIGEFQQKVDQLLRVDGLAVVKGGWTPSGSKPGWLLAKIKHNGTENENCKCTPKTC